MRQGEIAEGYGLQMANLPVLCLLELEQVRCELLERKRCECCPVVLEAGKVRVRGAQAYRWKEPRSFSPDIGIRIWHCRTQNRALVTACSH